MPLLNPPDIVPEAMRYLLRALLAVPGQALSEAELKDLVAPPGLAEAMAAVSAEDDEDSPDDEREAKGTGQTITEASLAALRTLDMVTGRAERWTPGPDASRWARAKDITAREFASALLASLRKHHAPPGSSKSGGADDLVHGLSMLYSAADPFTPFDCFDSRRGSRRFVDWQKDRLGDDSKRWPLANAERWHPFRRWAVYLGTGRIVGTALIPDASIAMERSLRLQEQEYSIEEFVQQSLAVLPFLDSRGSMFGHDAEVEADHAVLSPGLSLTLTILEAKGTVAFSRRSDVGGRTLRVRSDRSFDQRVTHVLWNGLQVGEWRAS